MLLPLLMLHNAARRHHGYPYTNSSHSPGEHVYAHCVCLCVCVCVCVSVHTCVRMSTCIKDMHYAHRCIHAYLHFYTACIDLSKHAKPHLWGDEGI